MGKEGSDEGKGLNISLHFLFERIFKEISHRGEREKELVEIVFFLCYSPFLF